ncbi:ABC transporter permease [Actinomadura rudentiformis]|uniref:Transport permease protein n=1 Tax=Actinomadura rudentiformis TaxID=359158 RepID=A0A6H9YUW7_9ACTN|nr:ABC transporter permease [Actinomadura rudentiformis]KAB2344400.1 ABC transporter permease subunit [Actinomadura rudentiformis]
MTTTLTHTWYLSGRRLHAIARQPFVIVGNIFQPAIWLFLFGELFKRVAEIPGFGGGSYLDYLIPGVIAMNAMNANMWAGMGTLEEIDRGTLNRFLVSPASRVALMNANVVEQAVTTTLQSIIILLLGLLAGAELPGGLAGAAAMVAAAVLVGIVFGSLSNAAGMVLRQREAIIGIYIVFMLPLTFLSSAFMPTGLMPGWLRHIATWNPLDWAVRAGRSALSTNPEWGDVSVRLGGLLALAIVCVAVSVATFRSYQKSV